MKDQNRLLEYLWNNQEETLGMNFFSDTFIGPNKIRREGISRSRMTRSSRPLSSRLL